MFSNNSGPLCGSNNRNILAISSQNINECGHVNNALLQDT